MCIINIHIQFPQQNVLYYILYYVIHTESVYSVILNVFLSCSNVILGISLVVSDGYYKNSRCNGSIGGAHWD